MFHLLLCVMNYWELLNTWHGSISALLEYH